ncbi:hypothetical protein HCJ76_31395 [Streptomyces sp. MC1]|uniref:hypothetical protein n=1 Tax=Streptomyces sp. MC1 TaxID=295105 RepID=UPI0018C91A0F|nr:hypothetical protein [Streptomyces sp. MC1]MBG7702458.1 hypothetical protein [Streptomyces sp. MC1]
MILLSDPRVFDTPVADCGEPLVQIATTATVLLDPRERDEHGAYGRVRTGVLARLRSASDRLPAGIRLLVIEGHRPAPAAANRAVRPISRTGTE